MSKNVRRTSDMSKNIYVKRTPSHEKCQDTRGREFDTRPIIKSNVLVFFVYLPKTFLS